jgi:superfamily II DNA or RNA helicase
MTLLGIPVSKIDKTKYMKQLRCVVTWIQAGGRGTMECATGFGKSIIACLAIKKMIKRNSNRRFIVVVPTRPLKEQWEAVLNAFGLITHGDVYVINTIALKADVYKTDLLIIDEIHLMAAEQFSNVFKRVNYNWVMGLTATVKRLDGRENIVNYYAPIVVTINQKEAIKNGWINDFVEINIPVYLSRTETQELSNLSKQIRSYTAKFGDFDTMRSCMNLESAREHARLFYPDVELNGKTTDIVRDAVQGQNCIRMRQEILYNNECKVAATVELIKTFNLKTITFSQSTKFVDKVHSLVPSVAYHSYLQPEERVFKKTKMYRTLSGAERACAADVSKKYKVTENGFEVYWNITKKVGTNTLKKEALAAFENNVVKTICTAKALDQGFDVPDIIFGIDASRTSNPTQHTQRTGRIARNYTFADGSKKRGLFVNLYVPNSQDEKWLTNCQSEALWSDDLEDAIEIIKGLFKNDQNVIHS